MPERQPAGAGGGLEPRLGSVSPDPLSHDSVSLDQVNQCLLLGGERVSLTPKAYALLVYLSERPRRLVTKEELLDQLWSRSVVTDGVLKVCVRELRVALGDDAREPRIIKTVHGEGYVIGVIVERA